MSTIHGFGRIWMPRSGRSRSAFSLIELLVVVSIISLLAALLMPAIAQVKIQARSLQCKNTLRQIGIAAYGYMSDWQGIIPGSSPDALPSSFDDNLGWCFHVASYLGFDFTLADSWQVKPVTHTACSRSFTCSEQPDGNFGGNWSSYNINAYATSNALWYGQSSTIRPLSSVMEPSGKVFLIDWQNGQFINPWDFYTFNSGIGVRHGNACNILFLDGHVKGYAPPSLPMLSSTDSARVAPWLDPTVPGSPDL